jgi:hypothetical protein
MNKNPVINMLKERSRNLPNMSMSIHSLNGWIRQCRSRGEGYFDR